MENIPFLIDSPIVPNCVTHITQEAQTLGVVGGQMQFYHTFSLCASLQRGGDLQHGGLHLRYAGGGSSTRVDPRLSQDVHQQESGAGDQQLA